MRTPSSRQVAHCEVFTVRDSRDVSPFRKLAFVPSNSNALALEKATIWLRLLRLSTTVTAEGVAVGVRVKVGGAGVLVGTDVAVGSTDVAMGVRVAVGGTDVLVGTDVAVDGTEVAVGVRVAVGGTGVLVGTDVAVGGTGVTVAAITVVFKKYSETVPALNDW